MKEGKNISTLSAIHIGSSIFLRFDHSGRSGCAGCKLRRWISYSECGAACSLVGWDTIQPAGPQGLGSFHSYHFFYHNCLFYPGDLH